MKRFYALTLIFQRVFFFQTLHFNRIIATMGKRPQGLHKAALAKKKKRRTEAPAPEPVAEAGPATTETTESPEEEEEEEDGEEVTFQFDKDVDPNNELESLYAIYESYQNSNSPPKLVYLLIHTCDNILRLHSKKLEKLESGEPAAEKKEGDEVDPIDLIPEVLPAQFHNIYAISLLAMARIVQDEEEEDEDEEGDEDEEEKPAKKGKSEDAQKDTAKDFIEAGLDRVNSGLETHPDSYELLFTRARARIVKVAEQLKRDTVNTLRNYPKKLLPPIDKALQDFEKAEKIVLADSDKKYTEQELITIQLLLEIGEHIGSNWVLASMDEDEDGDDEQGENANDAEYAAELRIVRDNYLDWSKERYLNMAKASDDGKGKTASSTNETAKKTPFQIQREASLGIGKYYLAKAAPYIEEYEEAVEMFSDDEEDDAKGEDDDKDEEDEAKRLLGVLRAKARQFMTLSIEYLLKSEDEEDGDNLVLIAEAQISLANLLQDETEQELLYKEASLRLKRAQRLGAGDFTELIRDLQR